LLLLSFFSLAIMIQQILFILVVAFGAGLFTRRIRQIRRNILVGRKEYLTDFPGRRWKNVILLAFGQKKMFRNPLVAVLHIFIYAGFVIINLEILEIILDGLSGNHRMFYPLLGKSYLILIGCFEILAVLVIIACIIFLIRRNVLRLRRFISPDLNGWPRSDANYILVAEIALMCFFLTMNSADLMLQSRSVIGYRQTGPFWISGILMHLLAGWPTTRLILLERTCWWLHILGIFSFMNYLPFSKHLHILLAFPNTYYGSLKPVAGMANMPEVQREARLALDPSAAAVIPGETVGKFGARDVQDLSWKNLLDAYSCTECGRCSAVCPATITGKKLSPRKIMMDTRDRLEEVGSHIDRQGAWMDDHKSLLGNYVTSEELLACTTCNACVQECPVSISPLSIILQLRRYLIMEASGAPQPWNMMFANMENNQAPWKFPPDDRDKWREKQG